MKKLLTRDSNFELLRIVAIFFVFVHHSLIATKQVGYGEPYSIVENGLCGVFFNSICITGVNLFIMISGWYGIKNPIKALGRILIETTIVIGILYLFFGGIGLLDISLFGLFDEIVFRIRFNWFVYHYIMLCLFVPIIECSIDKLNQSEWSIVLARNTFSCNYFTLSVILMSILVFWFGWFRCEVNINGYSVYNFIYIYLVARWLKIRQIPLTRKVLFFIILFSSVLLTAMFVWRYDFCGVTTEKDSCMHWWGYNNPLIVVSTICIFLLFAGMQYKSRIVNYVSRGVFGVYIIHLFPFVEDFWKGIIASSYQSLSLMGVLVVDLILFAVFIFISLLINGIISSPLLSKYNKLFDYKKL